MKTGDIHDPAQPPVTRVPVKVPNNWLRRAARDRQQGKEEKVMAEVVKVSRRKMSKQVSKTQRSNPALAIPLA